MFGFKRKPVKKQTLTFGLEACREGLVLDAQSEGKQVSFFATIRDLEQVETEGESFRCYQAFRQFLSCLTPDDCESLEIAQDDEDRLLLGWNSLIFAARGPELQEEDLGEEPLSALYSGLISEVFSDAGLMRVSLENQGTFREQNFAVRTRYTNAEGNRLYPPEGAGGVVSEGKLYLLSVEQFELVKALEMPWPDDHHAKHLHWAELQRLAEAGDAFLSKFLQSERATLIEKVRPLLNSPEPGVLEIGVEVEHPESEKIVADILRTEGSKEVYSFSAPGQRHRVFPTKQVRKAIEGIGKNQRLQGEQAARFLQDPQSFLSQECWDLSQFSERVERVGFHVYRPVESVGAAGGVGDYVWEDDGSGRRALVHLRFAPLYPGGEPLVLDISDPSDEQELRRRVGEAMESGESFLEVLPGHLVPLAAFPQRFLNLPAANDQGDEKVSKNLTAQPVTNLEELEFGEAGQKYLEDPDALPLPLTLAPEIALHWYQMEGYQKIGKVATGKVSNAGGFLLADDMGLGKTLQVLTVLARLAEEDRKGPHLVVAKPSLLENWTREMHRFFPRVFSWPILLDGRVSLERLKTAEVVLTSYDQLRRRQLDLARVNWDTVILDEAQKIKDPTTQVTRAAWALPARTRIAMTGTPVENSLTDLWSISNFFQPGLLDSLAQFRERHQSSSGEAANLSDLRETLEPLYLRRTKAEVASDLPTLESIRYELPMGDRQRELYHREMEARNSGARSPLETVNRLLQLCTHSSLIDYTELWPCTVAQCPKLFKTLEILESVQMSGEKALIFTKFIKAQYTLQQALRESFRIEATIINGSTKGRQDIIDRFTAETGFSVLILSPEAAGVGLNITAANHVIHFTRSWNPAIERQSTDRAYRLGQTRPVKVYYPIIVDNERGTIEQRLDELLERKMELFNDIFVPAREKQIRAAELLG